MSEYKDECKADGLREAVGISEAPGQRGQEEEEGEEVGKGGVGAVVCVFRLFVVEHVPEHLLRCYQQMRHLPYGELEVHLREFE